MKCINNILILLVLGSSWSVKAAALEQAAAQHNFQLMESFDKLPQEARAQIIARGFPSLTRFLMCIYAHKNPIELPYINHSFITLSPHNDKLIILPYIPKVSELPRMIIRDLRSQEILHQVKNPYEVYKEALITPDGNRIITCTYKGRVSIWDMDAAVILHDLGNCCRHQMVLTADGSKLVTLKDKEARIWNVATGEEIVRLTNDALFGSTQLALNLDGTKLACGYQANCIRVFDTKLGRELFCLHHDGFATVSLAFNSDETELIADVCKRAHKINFFPRYVWSMVNGEQLSRYDYECCRGRVIDGHKIEHKWADNHYIVELYDDQTGQLMFSFNNYYSLRPTFKNNWLAISVQDCDKIYAWNFDILHPVNFALFYELSLLSWRQIVLLGLIQKAANRGRKYSLDGDNPSNARMIYDYGMLPNVIKECVKDHVSFSDYQ